MQTFVKHKSAVSEKRSSDKNKQMEKEAPDYAIKIMNRHKTTAYRVAWNESVLPSSIRTQIDLLSLSGIAFSV